MVKAAVQEAVIKLTSVDDVKVFCEIACKYEFDIDIRNLDRHYPLDAKSLMCLFTLDLRNPLIVSVVSTDKEVGCFFNTISQFLVD